MPRPEWIQAASLNRLNPMGFLLKGIDFDIERKLASASWSPSCFSKVLGGLESPIAWNFIVNYPTRRHRLHVATSSIFSSICILSIIVFSYRALCQATFRPLTLGLKFLIPVHLFSFDFDLSSGRATESSNGWTWSQASGASATRDRNHSKSELIFTRI